MISGRQRRSQAAQTTSGLGTKWKQRKPFLLSVGELAPTGSHDADTEPRGSLGDTLELLATNLYNGSEYNIIELLRQLQDHRQSSKSLEEWRDDYQDLQTVLQKREQRIQKLKKSPVPNLNADNSIYWGSIRQLKCGYCIIQTLGKSWDPSLGCLLNPTGGLVGAGNRTIYKGDHLDALVLHGIVHDAGGYCYNYHATSPGYNYLGTWFTLFPTKSPMSCQIRGIYWWKKKLLRKRLRAFLHSETTGGG